MPIRSPSDGVALAYCKTPLTAQLFSGPFTPGCQSKFRFSFIIFQLWRLLVPKSKTLPKQESFFYCFAGFRENGSVSSTSSYSAGASSFSHMRRSRRPSAVADLAMTRALVQRFPPSVSLRPYVFDSQPPWGEPRKGSFGPSLLSLRQFQRVALCFACSSSTVSTYLPLLETAPFNFCVQFTTCPASLHAQMGPSPA